MKKENIGYTLLIIITVLSVIGVFILPPIEQNESYHIFSDTNMLFHIPNFWNVISNLPFFIIGTFGLYKLNTISENKIQYFILFLGITLVSIGSGYYHLKPDNYTLVWDRIPMTIAFMSLFSIIISEFIDFKKDRFILFPALVIGISSVLVWMIINDLRFYAFIQFYPLLTIPVILIFFKSKYNLTIGYWLLLLAYIIAKLMEHYDFEIHHCIVLLSGHTLKHFFSEIGLYVLLFTYINRKKIQ